MKKIECMDFTARVLFNINNIFNKTELGGMFNLKVDETMHTVELELNTFFLNKLNIFVAIANKWVKDEEEAKETFKEAKNGEIEEVFKIYNSLEARANNFFFNVLNKRISLEFVLDDRIKLKKAV